MNSHTENIVPAAASPVVDIAGGQAQHRFTWYTVGLVGFFVLDALLGRLIPQHEPRPFNVGAKIFTLVFQWLLFLVAYRGLRASGNSLAHVLGKSWSSLPELWKDMKPALMVVGLIYVSTYSLMHLSAFKPPFMGQPKTGLQYFVSLLVAISAGLTEEVIFRGLILSQFHILTRNISVAVILQSFVFALAHGGQQSITQFLKHSFSGCLFAYLALRRKSLWPAILAHVLLDVTSCTVQYLTK